MSETLIASLQSQVERLTRQLAETQAEAKRHRIAKRKSADRVAELEQAVLDLESDRDTWKGKAEALPDDDAKGKKVVELEGQLAARDRRDQLREAVGASLADKASLDDVMAKAGYKPTGQALTAEQITELVGKAREAAPYLFKPEGQEPSDAPGGAANAGPLKSGPGGGQGPPDKSSARVTYTRDEVASPGWQQKRPELVEALVKGTAVLAERK